MLIIGLVLILAAAVLGFGAVYDGGESATVEVFGATREVSFSAAFLIGAATMLLLLLGLWLLTSSMGRARRRRVERKDVKQRHRDSVARLEDERTQLRAENERLSEKLGRSDAQSDNDRIVDAGRQGVAPGHDDTSTRHEAVPPMESSTSHDSPAGTVAGTERGAHARDEAYLRDSERASVSRNRDGEI